MPTKFLNYQQAKKLSAQQLQDKPQANERLLAGIYEREGLVIEFRQKLKDYLEARNRRYAINDACFSIDGKLRAAFIKKLLEHLDTYHQTGNSEPVRNYIAKHIGEFPGNNLRAILNKITISLIDADKNIPESFTDLPSQAEDLNGLHVKAERRLIILLQYYPTYVNNINNLFECINQMCVYGIELTDSSASCGVDVTELANKLRADVDHFVLNPPLNNLPTQESYTRFKAQFSARLHSLDDEMSKHRKAWKPILGNILIAVVTLGVAIGIKLAYSKLTTGRAAFFFDETTREEKIQSVDKALQALTAAPAI